MPTDTPSPADRFHGTDDDFEPPAALLGAPEQSVHQAQADRKAREDADALVGGYHDAVARFNQLSDTAGNPGAPTGAVRLAYTNHRGETAVRLITPRRIWFGATNWHPAQQWFLDAYDHDRAAMRSFALVDVHNWEGPGA